MNASRTKVSLKSSEKCSNHEVLQKQLTITRMGRNLKAKPVARSYDMEGHAKKCAERYCELAQKERGNFSKSQVLAWITIISNRRHWKRWESQLSKVCSQIVLNYW